MKIALLALLASGCVSMPMTHGIPNFAEVEPGIFRGGQPTPEGWSYLAAAGVSNVVKLNLEGEAKDPSSARFIYIPIDIVQQTIGPVRDYQISSAIANIRPGTFIHCSHGQDRTGLVIACYRLSRGWTKPDAAAEMLAHGFHKSLHGLWEFWEKR
jgi:tyrosine-protein phosphatase SIW14